MEEYKRIGIIGPGNRGMRNLGRQILERHKELKLSIGGIYDGIPENSDAARTYIAELNKKHGVPGVTRVYSSWEELIDDPAIDLVMVTTPQFCHKEPVIYAIRKGKKVYCDKPLAHTLEDAQAMYDVWQQDGRRNGILGFTRRYENAWIQAKEIVDSGKIGAVKMILLRSVIPFNVYFHRWHGRAEYSGDILNEKSAHHFDALNWFAGSQAQWISAMGGRITYTAREGYPDRCLLCERDCRYRFTYGAAARDQTDLQTDVSAAQKALTSRLIILDQCVYSPQNDVMDHAVVNIEYAGGVKAQLFMNVAGVPSDDQETLEVVGDEGRVLVTRHTGTIHVLYSMGKESMLIDARDNHEGTHFGADLRLITKISEFAHTGRQPAVNLEDGYLATKMAMKAVQSAKTHQMLKL
jgi:predicted dehydrogenase